MKQCCLALAPIIIKRNCRFPVHIKHRKSLLLDTLPKINYFHEWCLFLIKRWQSGSLLTFSWKKHMQTVLERATEFPFSKATESFSNFQFHSTTKNYLQLLWKFHSHLYKNCSMQSLSFERSLFIFILHKVDSIL